MRFKNKIIYLATALLMGVAVSSCSGDEEDMPTPVIPDGKPVKVGIELSVSELGLRGSRAEDYSESPIGENEKIINWFIAFLRNDSIVAVSEGTPGNITGDTKVGVMNDKVNVELPKGTYSAMAFGNMNNAKLRSLLRIGTKVDSQWKKSVLYAGNGGIGSFFVENQLVDVNKIPMSGYIENKVVKGTVDETFAIELVRQLCKVEFAFTNLSAKKIRIDSIFYLPVHVGDVYMFPDYANQPDPYDDNKKVTVAPTYPTASSGSWGYSTYSMKLNDFVLNANSSKTERPKFYVKESVAYGVHPTDHFSIRMRITRGVGEESQQDYATYALAGDTLKWMYRNDYVLFPITISDFVPDFVVYDYPPIGGYPVNVTNHGVEFYATFSSSGYFDVETRMRNNVGEIVKLEPYDGVGEAPENYVSYLGSDLDGFGVEYDNTSGLWHGSMFTYTDNVHIVLKFEFNINGLSYMRNLHLVSSNTSF